MKVETFPPLSPLLDWQRLVGFFHLRRQHHSCAREIISLHFYRRVNIETSGTICDFSTLSRFLKIEIKPNKKGWRDGGEGMWGGGGEPLIMDISPTPFPTLLRPLLLVLGHLEDLTITNILQTRLNVLPDPCGFYFMKKCRLTMGPCPTPPFQDPWEHLSRWCSHVAAAHAGEDSVFTHLNN